jgi:thiosulfate/3-mercaptopyruvate sulfurtransferase
MTDLALVIEPEELEKNLQNDDLLIVDMCKHNQYVQAHIPGAVFLDYNYIVAMNKPSAGLLPNEDHLSKVFSSLGLTADKHIVAYDDEGGGKACRLIWTLHALGHTKTSLLNGGLFSWANEGHPVNNEQVVAPQSQYKASYSGNHVIADADYIFRHLQVENVCLLDARSIQEYDGIKRFAEKAGHIPGAKHYEWTDGLDREKNYRFLPTEKIISELSGLGLSDDKEIIVYCQTHHRSSLSYVMLKHLGYEKVRGYPGSWSDWGNLEGMPVET